MKPIGQLAKEFRLSKGWNSSAMAKAVGTSRQNIEALEAQEDRVPRYLGDLAMAMGVSADALLRGESVPVAGGDGDARLGQPSSTLEAARVFYMNDLGEMLKQFTDKNEMRKAYALAMSAIETYSKGE